jgi:hypothetical protein
MQKFIALISLILCSCAVVPPPVFEQEYEIQTLDLTQYAKENFLVSPTAYGGNYVTVAYIHVIGRNGAIYVQTEEGEGRAGAIKEEPYVWAQSEVDLKQVIEAAVTAAKQMGANGLVSVIWSAGMDSIQPPGASTWNGLERGTIQIEGWAIKRALE